MALGYDSSKINTNGQISDTDDDSMLLPEAWLFLLSGICGTITGSASVICALVVVTVIVRYKKLHTSCFYLLAGQAAFGCVMGVSFVADGLRHVWAAGDPTYLRISRWSCLLVYSSKTVSNAPWTLITCLIGAERLLAIRAPHIYKRIANGLAAASCVGCLLVGILHGVLGFTTAEHTLPNCVDCTDYFASLDPAFRTYLCAVDVTLFVCSVSIYAAIVGVVRTRTHTTRPLPERRLSEGEKFVRRQLALIPLIRAIMAAFVLLGVLPSILSVIAPLVADGRYQSRIILFETMLRSTGGLTETVVLAWKSAEFRSAFLQLLRFKR